MELISAGCSHQRHAGRPRQGCPALSPPSAPAGMHRHARGCGDPRARRVEAARGATAGAEPIVQPAPMSKLHLNRLSSRRPLSKWGFERLRSPGSALANGTRLCREARPAHTCLPLRRSPAFIARIKGRLWWVFVCTVSIPLFTEETFRLLEFSLATGG